MYLQTTATIMGTPIIRPFTSRPLGIPATLTIRMATMISRYTSARMAPSVDYPARMVSVGQPWAARGQYTLAETAPMVALAHMAPTVALVPTVGERI
jgi:hypothetical protein